MRKGKILEKIKRISRPRRLALKGLFFINGDLNPKLYPDCIILAENPPIRRKTFAKQANRKWTEEIYQRGALTLALHSIRKARA